MGLEQEQKLSQRPEFSRRSGLNGEVDRYLTYLTRDKARPENTILAYRNDLSQFCGYLGLRNTPFDWNSVARARLVGFVSSLEEKNYASTTVARKVAAVKSFFHWLTAEEVVKADPTVGFESPTVTRSFSRLLNEDEIAALLAAPEARGGSEAKRDKAMLSLLNATGVCVTELISLDMEDIELYTNYLRVIGRGGHERQIPFGLLTHQAVEEYLRDTRSVLTRHLANNTPALFVNHRGERLTRQGIWLILKAHAKTASLTGSITPHTLRRSFAIHLLEENARSRDVQKLLGHTNPTATRAYGRSAKAKVA